MERKVCIVAGWSLLLAGLCSMFLVTAFEGWDASTMESLVFIVFVGVLALVGAVLVNAGRERS